MSVLAVGGAGPGDAGGVGGGGEAGAVEPAGSGSVAAPDIAKAALSDTAGTTLGTMRRWSLAEPDRRRCGSARCCSGGRGGGLAGYCGEDLGDLVGSGPAYRLVAEALVAAVAVHVDDG